MNRIRAISTSVWTWLIGLLAIALIAYLSLNLSLGSAGEVRATLADRPPSEFVVTARGVIDIEGGLIRLSANRTGVFSSVSVEEGDWVTKGQVLAVQDDRDDVIALRNAEVSLENAHIELERNLLELAIDQRDAERGALQREQDAIPQQQFENRLDAVKRSELAVARQRNTIVSSQAAVETARFNLAQRKLLAPVDGKVVKVNISPGSGVSAQNVSTAIVIVPKVDKLIRVAIGDIDADSVFAGQEVEIKHLLRAGDTYSGKVAHVAEVFSTVLEANSAVPTNSRKAPTIEVVVNAGDIPLRLGQEVLVQFKRPEADGAAN